SVVGDAVPLLSANFAIAATASAGPHASAFSATLISFTDVSDRNFLQAAPAWFADVRGSLQPLGRVDVWSAASVGVLAYSLSTQLFNTYPLNGQSHSASIVARVVRRSACLVASGCSTAGDR